MQIFFEMICAGGGGEDAAQAQGLRPFAMWLSAHVRAGVSGGEEGRRAGSRPAAFRYVAVGAYSSGKIRAWKSASSFQALPFPEDCAACRKNKKSVDKR